MGILQITRKPSLANNVSKKVYLVSHELDSLITVVWSHDDSASQGIQAEKCSRANHASQNLIAKLCTNRVHKTCCFSSLLLSTYNVSAAVQARIQSDSSFVGIGKRPKGQPHRTWKLNTEKDLQGPILIRLIRSLTCAIFPTEIPLCSTAGEKKSMQIFPIC